ncbi:uncharacterized protein LOC108679562 [Hyalella azteca]|uniref:Uncharacterized protein LOC108679562 n=1 Tax=Hyalella azteca TaxID=294128 RepID=A0A8B7PCG4_HYAAZ|nr:uncharacterized protein LOC108679562 [Hyalella azteca]
MRSVSPMSALQLIVTVIIITCWRHVHAKPSASSASLVSTQESASKNSPQQFQSHVSSQQLESPISTLQSSPYVSSQQAASPVAPQQSAPYVSSQQTKAAAEADSAAQSFGQFQARSPLMYRVATNYGDFRQGDVESPLNVLLHDMDDAGRGGRHFSTLDSCSNSVCDYVLRQANSLARIKLLREYIKDTVGMLDRLVTAVDSQLVTAGDTLARSVGSSCRAARPVLSDITKSNVEVDRGRSEAVRYWYPIKK